MKSEKIKEFVKMTMENRHPFGIRQRLGTKFFALLFMILACVILSFQIRFIMGLTTVVHSHVFYIPIVLAALWYRRKAVYVALFLGALHILTAYFSVGLDVEIFTRAAIFVLVAYVTGLVSEKELKARELAKERKFSENIITTIPDSLLVLDKDLRIKKANRAFYETFQTEPEKVTGSSIAEVLHDEEGELTSQLTKLSGTEDMLENFEMPYKSEELGERILSITARGMCLAEEEEEEEELIVIEDITERKRAEEAVSVAYDALYSSISGIILTNIEGKITYANPAFLRIFEYRDKAEVIGKNAADLFASQQVKVFSDVKDITQERKGRAEEFTTIRKDGTTFPVEVFSSDVTDNEGNIVGRMASFNDITERKAAEDALAASKAYTESIIQNFLDTLIVVDTEAKIQTVNPATCHLLGYTEEELIGQPVGSVFAEEEEEEEVRRVFQFFRQRETVETLRPQDTIRNCALTYKTKDGRLIPMFFNASVVVDERGSVTAVVAGAKDITELKLAAEALKESEEKYRSLVNNISLGIFRSTPEPTGRFLEVNPAMERIIGYSREELLQMDVSDLYLHPEEREAVLEEIASATGMTAREPRLRKKDGTEIIVSDRKIPVRNDAGQIMYFDGILEDITERKKMQAQLVQAEKLSAIGTMAAGIAHELLNPMMGMLNFAQYCLEHTAEDDRRYPVLQDMKRETKRCTDIVRNLTTFSRMGKQDEEGYQKESFATIIDRIVKLLSYRIEKEHVSLTQHVAKNTPKIWMEVNGMQQALLNLISNALDAVEESEEKEIHIEVHREGQLVEVTIADSGRGIPAANLGRIFDPFFTTKPVGQGTGMGLALSQDIILEHGGDITCESKLGVGTTFKIVLPVETKGGAK